MYTRFTFHRFHGNHRIFNEALSLDVSFKDLPKTSFAKLASEGESKNEKQIFKMCRDTKINEELTVCGRIPTRLPRW